MPVEERFFLFEDTETTGTVFGEDVPIEIASILTDRKCKEIARFDAKIQFDHAKMKPQAAEKNGYVREIWEREAIPFYKYDMWLAKHIPFGCVAVPIGHNPYFDRNILDLAHYKPNNKFFKWAFHCIDTAGLAYTMDVAGVISVPNVKLETVAAALKLDESNAHRGMADCERAKKIFEFVVMMMQQ